MNLNDLNFVSGVFAGASAIAAYYLNLSAAIIFLLLTLGLECYTMEAFKNVRRN